MVAKNHALLILKFLYVGKTHHRPFLGFSGQFSGKKFLAP